MGNVFKRFKSWPFASWSHQFAAELYVPVLASAAIGRLF